MSRQVAEARQKLEDAQAEYDTAHAAYKLCVESMYKLRDEMRTAGKALTSARRDYRTAVNAAEAELERDKEDAS